MEADETNPPTIRFISENGLDVAGALRVHRGRRDLLAPSAPLTSRKSRAKRRRPSLSGTEW